MPTVENRIAADPVGEIASACHDPYRSGWDELDDRVAKQLLGAVAVAREAIAEAETTASESESDDPTDRIAEYRRAIDSAVLEPLIRTAKHVVPAVQIQRVFKEAHDQALAGATGLPATVELAWGEGALSPRPTDGLTASLGKPLARLFSPARDPDATRPAPIRDVAMRHLRSAVFEEQNRHATVAMRAWTEWYARLEAAWATWGQVALPILTDPHWGGSISEAWEDLIAAGRALELELQELDAEAPHALAALAARDGLERSRAAIEGSLAVAGTALFRLGAPPVPPVEDLERAAELWSSWNERCLARLELQRATLAMLSGTYGVQARLRSRLTKACLASAGELGRIGEGLGSLARDFDSGPGEGDLTRRLGAAHERAEALAREAMGSMPQTLDVVNTVQQLADATVEALQGMMRQVPGELVVRAGVGPPAGKRPPAGRTIAFQELTRQAFDALRIERIRAAVMRMPDRYQKIRNGVDGLPEVVSFGFDAARQELEAGEDGCEGRAAMMAAEALKRASETVRDVSENIGAAIDETGEDVSEEITEGCDGILERAGARGVQAQFLAAQSRFTELWLAIVEAATPLLRRARLRLARWWSWLKGWVTLGVRRGSAMVGTDIRRGMQAARPLQQIGNPDALGDAIPLVYRKLFAPAPVADPALLVGREEELADALARWQPANGIDPIPLLIRARPGSGITSYLNALAQRIGEAGGTVVQTRPPGRIRTEAELSAMLSELLGLPPTDSVDSLARVVLRAPDGSIPNAVMIGALEYLYLRVPGGTDTLERLLTFMAETEPRIFWIGGITTSAWQFVSKAEPTAVSQVDGLDLPQLTTDELRTAVLARHRRSGLNLLYEEPTEGRRLLKRRLRSLRGTDRHQEILEADFFDRLSRASEGTVGLALHQWLTSADFTWREGQVLMRPLTMPDFSVLEGLDLAQNFTLKALMEHRNLTLEEHDAIFRVPRQESYHLIESLSNRHIIEPVGRVPDAEVESEILEGLRYRIRPALTGAILNHLKSRNIVH